MDNESILTSIKKNIGYDEAYEEYDKDLIMHINSVFSILNQLGAGPKEGFYISDKSKKWSDYIDDPYKLQFIKSYVYLKVKMIFDPPTSSSVIESFNKMISEYEWRITEACNLN